LHSALFALWCKAQYRMLVSLLPFGKQLLVIRHRLLKSALLILASMAYRYRDEMSMMVVALASEDPMGLAPYHLEAVDLVDENLDYQDLVQAPSGG
jgi:hypothetical protein